jgi:hypothetical protein
MFVELEAINVVKEAELLADHMQDGNVNASKNLARLIQADETGVFQPFAEALTARLQDHLARWAELGQVDPHMSLEDEVYSMLKSASMDWDGRNHTGRFNEDI